MLFFASATDGTQTDCTQQLVNSYAGMDKTAVWILGASVLDCSSEEIQMIKDSPIPVFGMNYAGRGKNGEGWIIKPDLWTAFDSTPRFSRSIFLDPTIKKFCRSFRTMDLVPSTDVKLCDAPNTYFFPSGLRTYSDFFSEEHDTINHSLDSFIQTLDIAYRLGFRKFYCVGCELKITPSQEQVDYAVSKGVKYIEGETYRNVPGSKNGEQYHTDLLRDFFYESLDKRVENSASDLATKFESMEREKQYSFDETKPFQAAMQSDLHYWNTVQYLRLARRNMALKGIELFSTTKTSRLSQWFPTRQIRDLYDEHDFCVQEEKLLGVYSGKYDEPDYPFHRDIKPYDWQNHPINKNQTKTGGCKGCNKNKEKPIEQQQLEELNGVVLNPKGMLDKIEHVRMNNIELEEVL